MAFWNRRDYTAPLSTHFTTKEFECHCGTCSRQSIEPELLRKLEQVRQDICMPITINSGYRCARYQQMLKAKGYETAVGISTHELGQAVDISCADMTELLKVCEKHFKAIGVAKTFLHVDLRSDKDRRWYYK